MAQTVGRALPVSSRRPPARSFDATHLDPAPFTRRGAPPIFLRVIAFSVFFFPASMVLAPLGAAGTVPMILSLLLAAFWLVSWALGLHDPIPSRHPGRLAIGALIFVTLVTYALLMIGATGGSTVAGRASADRWLLLLLASAAIIFVAGETMRSVEDAMRYVRAILAGAFVCCVIAVIQFYGHVNPMDWISSVMIGFTDNGGDTTYQLRGSLIRVAGSTFTPIELGVVCSMVLPLSIWRLLFDPIGRKWFHVLQTVLLVFGVATTISRSGILSLAVVLIVFVPFLPTVARKWAVVAVPVAVAALFVGVPGLISTIGGALTPAENDPNITTRTNNYPRVLAMFEQHPWFGMGPGTYLPKNALFILDNQYLNSIVTMGVLGLVGIVFYLVLPALTTIHAARHSDSPALRTLAGAVAAGCAVGAVGSATFDSLSFPVFALTYPALVGLGGAIWIMVKNQPSALLTDRSPARSASRPARPQPSSLHGGP